MADLSYTVDVKGHEDLPKLAAGIDAVATALGNGKDIAKKLAEFKAAMGGMGGSLDGLKSLETTLKDSIGGLSKALKSEMDQLRGVLSTAAADFKSSGQKAGKALSDGLVEGVEGAGRALKLAADRNLKLNAKYATDIETATRQIQEKGSSAMLQSLMNRASNIQRILQTGGDKAVAIVQKTYGSDFVAAMRDGLAQQLTTLTNAEQATTRLRRTQQEQTIKEGREAAAKLAEATAKARANSATKLTTEDDTRRMLGLATRSEMNTHSASIRAQMQAEVDKLAVRGKAATKLTTEDDTRRMLGLATRSEMTRHLASIRAQMEQGARDAQARDIMQVRAATNNPVGAFQRYNSSTQTAGALIGANSTNALTGSVSAGSVSAVIPKAQDIGQVKQLSTAFQKLTIDGNNVHSMARGLASGFNLLWLTWGNLVPLFAGAAISNGFVQTVKMGSQVGHTLKIIEVLGENTTKEMAGLNDELLRMGHSGPFGPLEVAEAMKTLSLAGLKVNEILAVTPDVLNFSIAGTTDLKTAADTLVSVSTAFGMGAGGFGRVSDVISKAAADSKSSVESFSSAMKTASVINKQYGVSLEDTATGIAALSQLGIEGSAAGTALRNAYADLSGRSIQVAKVLKQQGIEMRTATGEFRPMIEVVAELDKKLRSMDGISQKNLLQSIASERGAKAIIELLELVRTQAKDTSKTLGNALEEMRAGIEESYGFAAISAAKLSQTTESQFKAVKATLQTSMVQAFKDAEPELLLISDRLKKTLSSPEFIADLSAIVTFVAKAIASFISFGSALVDHAALVVGLAGGYKILQAALVSKTAATVADTSATLANNAAKAGGLGLMGGLARLLPGIGTAITVAAVAWSLYDMWQGRSVDTSAKADELYNNNIIKNLQDEALRLKTLNDLRATGLSLTEAQAQMDANKKQGDSSKLGQTGYARARQEEEKAWKTVETMKAKNIRFMQNPDGFGYVELDYFIKKAEEKTNVATAAWRLATQNIAATAAAAEQVKEENKRSAQITADEVKQRKDAITGLFGDIKYGLDDKPRGANSRTQKPRSYDEQTLPNLQKQMDSELAVIKARFDSEKAIQDSEYKNLLVTQGQYQANLLASTVTYEQESLASIEAHAADYVNAYVEQYAEIKKVRDGFKPDSENWKAEDAKLEALRNKATTDMQADEDKHVKIKLDSNKRQILAAQDLAGETRKLIKADEEYWTKSKLETDKIESMQKVAEQYRNINTSVFSNATALKAEAEAIAESKAQHKGQLENIRKEIELRIDAIAALEELLKLERAKANITGNSAVSDEFEKTIGANKAQLEGLRDRYSKSVAEGTADGARRGALAYEKEMEAKASAVTDSVAGAIETAIFKSGKEGGKALRDYLQAELIRKPLMAIVKAIIQPISSMVVGGLLGGTASAAGGAGGGGLLGNIASGASLLGKFGIGGFGAGFSSATSAASMGAGFVGPPASAAGGAVGMGAQFAAVMPWLLGATAIAALWKPLFGRKLKDSGIQGTFGGERGFEGESFEYYKGGLFRSDKTKTNPLAEEARKVLGDAFNMMRIQIGTFATTLGLNTDKIADFTTKIKVSTKGLSDADAEKAIQEALATANNKLAEQVIGTWEETVEEDVTTRTYKASEYAREGEKAIDTLTRLATSLAATNEAFKDLGIGLYEASLAGADMASQLVDLFGGIEGFVAATAAYYDKFYSEDEKREAKRRRVEAAFAEAGLSLPDINAADARAQFRATMESIDLTTEAGRKQWATLVQVSGMYADITEGAVDAASAMREAAEAAKKLAEEQLAELNRRRKLLSDYAQEDFKRAVERDQALLNKQADVLKETMGTLKSAIDSLTAGAKDIYNTVDSTSTAAAAQGMVAIEDALAGVRAGGSLNDYTGLMDSVSAARAGLNSNAYVSQFERDRDALVLAGQLSDLAAFGQTEYDVQEQQLNAIEAQLDYLKDLSEKADMFISGLSTLTGTVDYYFNRFMAVGVPNAREVLPSFAVGTNYVPNDMVAQIHEGEAIIPKAYNPSAGGGGNSGSVVEAIQTLTAEVANLKFAMAATAKNTSGLPQLVDHFDNVTEGGNAMRVEAI